MSLPGGPIYRGEVRLPHARMMRRTLARLATSSGQVWWALVQFFNLAEARLCVGCSSCGEYGIPDGGRGLGLNLELAEVELIFANALEEFDAGDGDFCSSKSFEAEHRADPGFDRTVILVNNIIQIF
jgi:hypothetical protein